MKHFLNTTGYVDLIDQPQMRQIPKNDGTFTEACSRRIAKINDYNGKVTQVTFKIEAFNEMAQQLAAIPQGHTIMVTGEFQNRSYTAQDGQQKWDTSLKVNAVGDCGPSFQPQPTQQGQPQYQGSGVAPSYNRTPQPNYGRAPAPQATQAPRQSTAYAPPAYANQGQQAPQRPMQPTQRTMAAPAPKGGYPQQAQQSVAPGVYVNPHDGMEDVPF